METELINEVLIWLGLASEKKQLVAALSVGDLILALYVISYFNIKKGSLIVAFLVCELWSYGVFSDWVTNQGFYAGYAAIYCLLYFHVKNNTKSNIAELSSIVLMILLVIGMIVDAEFYPETETSFWQSYEVNVLLLHAFIIMSFINWRLLRAYMGESVGGICRFFGVSDAFRFCWYNVTNKS